jgi:actin-related protein
MNRVCGTRYAKVMEAHTHLPPSFPPSSLKLVIFEDFAFAQCLRRPAAWFSAYEFNAAACAGAGGTFTTSNGMMEENSAVATHVTHAGVGGSSSSSSSRGRDTSSCIVIDSGFSSSHVLPFVQGKCVKKAVKRVNIGGKLLTNYLKELVSYRYVCVCVRVWRGGQRSICRVLY